MNKIVLFFVSAFLLNSNVFGCDKIKSVEEELGHYFKKFILDNDARSVYGMTRAHFQQLQLLDQNGKWQDPSFEKISDELLPETLSNIDIDHMIDRIVCAAESNPYLHAILEAGKTAQMHLLYKHVELEGGRVLPHVLTYAMALNNLTQAMFKDINILRVCNRVWSFALKDIFIPAYLDVFENVKFYTLNGLSAYTKAHDSDYFPPDGIRNVLPLNIIEASLSDSFKGNWENAEAGWVLAKHRPGGDKDMATGAGPSSFEKNQYGTKVFGAYMPFPKQWADLYTVWNLSFVSEFRNFPFFMVKLLIPQVIEYQKKPAEYMYSRALALYIQAHFELFGRVHGGWSKESMDWHTREISGLFGPINLQSANNYSAQVKAARASFPKEPE